MGDVKAFRGKNIAWSKEQLIDLATNPQLEHVQVVCHWRPDKDNPEGFTTVGWSPGMTNSAIIFGARHLMLASDETALGPCGEGE